MDWYEADVQALERARGATPLPPRPAVFYGSSSIRLWTTLARDLEDASAVNLGFGGSTLEACVWYFDRLVRPARPASLVVYAGDNDIGDGRTVDDVARSFATLSDKITRQFPAMPFGFISIKPSPARAWLIRRTADANAAIRRVIAAHPTAYYVDVFTPMLGPDGRTRTELFLDDGLHLSRAGYSLWAALLQPYRDRIFTKTSGIGHTGSLPSHGDGA